MQKKDHMTRGSVWQGSRQARVLCKQAVGGNQDMLHLLLLVRISRLLLRMLLLLHGILSVLLLLLLLDATCKKESHKSAGDEQDHKSHSLARQPAPAQLSLQRRFTVLSRESWTALTAGTQMPILGLTNACSALLLKHFCFVFCSVSQTSN